VLDDALPYGLLHTLDAIHLATAQVLAGRADAQMEAFVTYDKRLLAAAHAVGLPIASPGVLER
jgi:predicted nucleic acid-binding protein